MNVAPRTEGTFKHRFLKFDRPEPKRSWSPLDWFRSWFGREETVDIFQDSMDRRIAPRFPFARTNSRWKVLAGTSRWPSRVLDVSATGISLLVGAWQKTGSNLDLHVEDAVEHTGGTVPARVVRVQQAQEGQWLVGCIFDEPLTDEELTALR